MRRVRGMATVGLMLAAALMLGAALPSDAVSGPSGYRDNSGLTAGRFVWQPSLQTRGSVVIVGVPSKGMLHVFRNGIEIGIARALHARRSQMPRMAVYAVPPAGGADNQSDRLSSGRLIIPKDASSTSSSDANDPLRLPDAFASLLADALQDGAVAVMADRLDEPRITATDWPLNSRSRLVAVNETAQKATDVLGLSKVGPQARAPILVISQKDRSAQLFIDGTAHWTADVSIALPDGTTNVGTHMLSRLVAPSPLALAGRQYLAVSETAAMAQGRTGPATATPEIGHAVAVLEGVRFADRDKARAADLALATPGAMILITDGPQPENPRGAVVALWSASGQTDHAPRIDSDKTPAASHATRKAAKKSYRPARRSATANAEFRIDQPKRPFGPRDLPGMN